MQVDLASDTVFILKRKILSKEPLPVAVQKLVFRGRVMGNNNDLLHTIEGFEAGVTVQVGVWGGGPRRVSRPTSSVHFVTT